MNIQANRLQNSRQFPLIKINMKLSSTLIDTVGRLLRARYLAPLMFFFGCLGLGVRFLPWFLDLITPDMHSFLLPWTEAVHEGGFGAYGTEFSNYAPLYTYIIGLVSLLPAHLWAFGIKLASIIGDVLLALATGLLTAQFCNTADRVLKRNLAYSAFAVTLWLPTVILNSAKWGQCDVMWTACLVFSLLFFLRDKPVWGMVWAGLALSFKMQSLFFAPVILVLLLVKRASWWQTLIVPAVYVATCVPCVVAGRSWMSVLGVYFSQAADNSAWFCSSSSPYVFLDNIPFSQPVSTLIVAAVALFSLWMCIILARRYGNLSADGRLRLLLVFTAFCGVFYPYILPCMHERYMYFGDIATLIAAFCIVKNLKMWAAFAFTETASSLAVVSVLTWTKFDLTWHYISFACATVALIFLTIALRKAIKPSDSRTDD